MDAIQAVNEAYQTNKRTNLSALTSVAAENIIYDDDIKSKFHSFIDQYFRCEDHKDHKALVDRLLSQKPRRRGIEEVRNLINELVAMKSAADNLCMMRSYDEVVAAFVLVDFSALCLNQRATAMIGCA